MKRWIVLAAAVSAAALAPTPSGAVTTFPACGATLQSCIDGAPAGDTLRIATSAPIVETLHLQGKSLRLEAAAGFTPLIKGSIFAFGGDAPTHYAIDGLTVEGTIVGGPLMGDLELEITNNRVQSKDSYGGAIDIHSGTNDPLGNLTFTVRGNLVAVTGSGDSALCAGISGTYDSASARGTIEGNQVTVSGCGQGAAIRAVPSVEDVLKIAIRSNRVVAAGTSAGILVHGSPAGTAATIAGNVVTHSASIAGAIGGIVARASGTDARLDVAIVNNTVAFNKDGLLLSARGDLGASISGLVANNVVAENTRNGLFVDEEVAAAVVVLDNLVFHNGRDNFSGAGTLTADPRFVSAPADLRLAADSPAVNSGDNGAVPAGLGHDIDGLPRIFGGTVDRGAHEYPGPFKPAAPAQLRAKAASSTAIRLEWVDSSSDEDDFVIELWTGTEFVPAGSAAADQTTARIESLAPQTPYTFRVRARNSAGSSAPSNEATAETLPAAPAAPSNLVATLTGPDRVRLEWRDESSDEDGFRIERRAGSGAFTLVTVVPADSQTFEMAGLSAATVYSFRVRARNLGGDSAPSNVAEVETPAAGCRSGDELACLGGGRFAVAVEWRTPNGATGAGHPKALTGDSASFWFFAPENVELVVKVLDGCGVNQRFWVFATGLTNVGVRLTVTDTWSGESAVYENPQNRPFEPVQDTGALDVCGETGTLVEPAAPVASDSGCDAGDEALCVQDGRFRVEALWRTRDGQSGRGHAVALSADSGYFWFFDPANTELVVKVLDACAFADRFWVFAGGLTNVEVELRVTDGETGAVRTYRNPMDQAFRPLQDASAFATCK